MPTEDNYLSHEMRTLLYRALIRKIADHAAGIALREGLSTGEARMVLQLRKTFGSLPTNPDFLREKET